MSRLVVLCGSTIVDMSRVLSVVDNVVTFQDGIKVSIPRPAAEELKGMLERDGAGKDAER